MQTTYFSLRKSIFQKKDFYIIKFPKVLTLKITVVDYFTQICNNYKIKAY